MVTICKSRVTTKSALHSLLLELHADKAGITHGPLRVLDAVRTYEANCRESRDKETVIHFGREALQRDPQKALEAFSHLARTKFGQDKQFDFIFLEEQIPEKPTRPCLRPSFAVARAQFNGEEYGADYLSMVTGNRINALKTPPGEDPAGWAYGYNMDTEQEGWFPSAFVTTARFVW